MRTQSHVDLETAEKIIDRGIATANRLTVAVALTVVDAGGHLVACKRMDGTKFLCIEMALNKALTAVGAEVRTEQILPKTLPGEPGYCIQNQAGGRFTTLGGGIPIWANGQIAGAIGVSGGPVAQDIQIAEEALKDS